MSLVLDVLYFKGSWHYRAKGSFGHLPQGESALCAEGSLLFHQFSVKVTFFFFSFEKELIPILKEKI